MNSMNDDVIVHRLTGVLTFPLGMLLARELNLIKNIDVLMFLVIYLEGEMR